MPADRQTQTNRHVDHNTSPTYWGYKDGFIAGIMAEYCDRSLAVHWMNADRAPGIRQLSDQARGGFRHVRPNRVFTQRGPTRGPYF